MSGEKWIIATTGSQISNVEEQDLLPTPSDKKGPPTMEKEMGYPKPSLGFLLEEFSCQNEILK